MDILEYGGGSEGDEYLDGVLEEYLHDYSLVDELYEGTLEAYLHDEDDAGVETQEGALAAAEGGVEIQGGALTGAHDGVEIQAGALAAALGGFETQGGALTGAQLAALVAALGGGFEDHQTPHAEQPGTSNEIPLGWYLDLVDLLRTHYPRLMSMVCLPEDDGLHFEKLCKVRVGRIRAILALLIHQTDHAGSQEQLGGAEGSAVSSSEGLPLTATENAVNHPGSPKQSVASGGKGTLGKQTDTDSGGEVPVELVGVSDPLDDFKTASASIVERYLSTGGDVEVAATELKQLGQRELHAYFVELLVSVSIGRREKEKELASVLLSALCVSVIDPRHIRDGFVLLLESADDFVVDRPEAVTLLALFLARALVDEIMSPAFLPIQIQALPLSSKGHQVVHIANLCYRSTFHRAELSRRRWGGMARTSFEDVKTRFAAIMKDYLERRDTKEACLSIRELGVPFFHHEVVKRALIAGVESQTAEPLVLNLLKEAASENLINSTQMVKGFYRIRESLDDLALDVPAAKTIFGLLVQKAIAGGSLDESFLSGEEAEPRQQTDGDGGKVERFKKDED